MEKNRRLVTSRTTIIKESFNIQTQPKSETNRTKIIKESFKPTTLKGNFELLKNFFLNVHEKINQNSNPDEQIKINNKKSLKTKIQKQKSISDEIPSQNSQLYESLIL